MAHVTIHLRFGAGTEAVAGCTEGEGCTDTDGWTDDEGCTGTAGCIGWYWEFLLDGILRGAFSIIWNKSF